MQHVSPKRLGLLALIYYKSGKNYLADSQSTVDQLAVGYFSQYKGLNSTFDVIRNKLGLDHAPDWQKLAKKLFKKKDKAIKKEKIDKKKNTFAESDNAESSADKQMNESTAPVNKKGKKQTKSTQQTTTTASVSASDESNASSATENDGNAESSLPPTTVDDFFITADGSNYLSTAVATKNQDDDSDDDAKGRTQQGKGFTKKPNESSFYQKSNNKRPVKLATNRSDSSGTKRKWADDQEQQASTEKQLKSDPNLHPSWQAKQKLKPTIAEFKGKKITFD